MANSQQCIDLEVLRHSYIVKRKLDISPLRLGLENKDDSAVLGIANYMIENARAYGFEEIEEIAFCLKESILAESYKEAFYYVDRLQSFLDQQDCVVY